MSLMRTSANGEKGEKMARTNCYWYHEYQDMNMTIPYCEELKIDDPHCETECKYFISKDDANKIIRKAFERREK